MLIDITSKVPIASPFALLQHTGSYRFSAAYKTSTVNTFKELQYNLTTPTYRSGELLSERSESVHSNICSNGPLTYPPTLIQRRGSCMFSAAYETSIVPTFKELQSNPTTPTYRSGELLSERSESVYSNTSSNGPLTFPLTRIQRRGSYVFSEAYETSILLTFKVLQTNPTTPTYRTGELLSERSESVPSNTSSNGPLTFPLTRIQRRGSKTCFKRFKTPQSSVMNAIKTPSWFCLTFHCATLQNDHMARPKKAIKRQEKLTLYYTKSEFRIITKRAENHGISKAEFARLKSLDHSVKTRLTPEEADTYRKLIGMSNNLNQLAHAANLGQTLQMKIIHTIQEIDQLIDRLK